MDANERVSVLDHECIAVFGGSGATGHEVVRLALRAGAELVLIDQNLPDETDRVEQVSYRGTDVLKDDLVQAIEGCDAVIAAMGVAFSPSNAVAPPRLYTEGSANILGSMERAGIERIAVISAAFVIDQPNFT